MRIDVHSIRAKKARLAKAVGSFGYTFSLFAGRIGGIAGVAVLFFDLTGLGLLIIALSLNLWMIAIWYERDLSILTPTGKNLEDRLSKDALALLPTNGSLSARSAWTAYKKHWQQRFLTHRLLVPDDMIIDLLEDTPASLETALQKASTIANNSSGQIDVSDIATATLLSNSAVLQLCQRLKISDKDIMQVHQWLHRAIEKSHTKAPYYGGIGRDWASGFTPKLNEYGVNISQTIQRNGAHFGSLVESSGVHAIRSSLSQNAKLISLVGGPGAGKTSHVYALAQSLLAESKDPQLRHKQLVGLDASPILSNAQRPGDVERIVSMLLYEASRAGNIILFLDNAHLFFEDGRGSFDATRLLQPIAESTKLQIILATTPQIIQKLKTNNPGFVSSLTPVALQEPDEATTQHILEDAALHLEQKNNAFVTYGAIQEAATLSNRYVQDMVQPGRAIKLLERSMAYAEASGIITAASVQRSIEETQGIKLTETTASESRTLLNMEDELHKRMINQTRAVSVVANALRRARAGVTNQNRPMGSFLFLGPTGVGKTELAKALSAVNFGSEQSMVRADMSEFQQASDVERILSDGGGHNSFLLSVRQQPYSVVLLDEIEKAHPNILNLLLQMLDEGQLTDSSGNKVSFRDTIIIATSNAGAQSIRERIEAGQELESFEKEFTDELINSGQFKPELLNRFDEIVLFRPLNEDELLQVVGLMLADVNKTLTSKHIQVGLTDGAKRKIVAAGYDPRLGARPMRRALQRTVEDTVAKLILEKRVNPGDLVTLDENDINS